MASSGGNGSNRSDQTSVPDFAIVQFNTKPLADYAGDIMGLAATQPTHGHKLDLNSQAANAYGRYVASVHQSFNGWLHSNAPQVQVVQEYSVVLDGVAVQLNGKSIDSLRAGPDVKDVSIDWLYKPSMDVSVPLIHAPQVWSTYNDRGEGIVVASIAATNHSICFRRNPPPSSSPPSASPSGNL